MNKISYKEASKYLEIDYSSASGDLIWRKKKSNRAHKGSIAGHKNILGYIQVRINGESYLGHRLVWLLHYGYLPENEIDHINRTPWSNHPDNLREVSKSCNARNSGNFSNNTSGVKGVYWDKHNKKWYPKIKIMGKTKGLGRYFDFDNAVCARLAAEQCTDWPSCDSNSPANQYVQENILKAVG